MGDTNTTDSQLRTEIESEVAESSKVSECNEDLDSLLDSAINDFDKPLPKVTQDSIQTKAAASSTKNPDNSPSNSSNKDWTDEEFRQVQDAMTSFLQDDPNFQAQLDQLTSSVASGSVGASLDEAMKFISNSAQGIPGSSHEDLEQFLNNFGKMGLAAGDNNESQFPGFMPFFQNFMENLLSKEVLYPALKDIVTKYPGWIEENKPKLSEKVYENYVKQYELMTKICKEFETEHTSSDEGQKSFEKILGLMQQMQVYGNPPDEIMGDFSSALPFEELNNMKDGVESDQCLIM